MANENIIEKLDIEAPVLANAKEAIQELKELIEQAEQRTERYDLSWVGKARAYAEAGMPINKTLRPDLDESVNFNETENLFITGDNLDALKLLQESYLGQVDMIYIDPPYNTGKDFVYHDNFSKTMSDTIEDSKDAEGNRQYTVNSRDNGRYHSDWLSMMYPRLRIARNLLSDTGVIFISIDDNEQANLKLLCDEVFGEGNFVAEFVWVKKKKGSHLSKTIRSMTEYILCYTKCDDRLELYGEDAYSDKQQPLAKRTNAHKELKFKPYTVKTTLPNGIYKMGLYGEGTSSIDFKEFEVQESIVITELIAKGPFVWTQAKLDEEVINGTIVNLSSRFGFNVLRSDQTEKIKRPSTLIDAKVNVGTNEDAYEEIKKIFGCEGIMDYPKPVSLIKYLVNTITYFNKDAIILDFFAGSATTAHAVMKLNAEDGGNRKWILVQLDEETAENSEARKAGFQTIDAIARERIRRAAKSLCLSDESQNLPLFDGIAGQARNDTKDYGFRALKINTTNINAGIFKSPVDTTQGDLFSTVDNIKKERTPLDLLFGTLTAMTLELNKQLRIRNYEFRDGTVQTLYVYDYFGELSGIVACFDEKISEETIREIARMKPLATVFRDSSFAAASDKVNLAEHFRTTSPDTKIKVI